MELIVQVSLVLLGLSAIFKFSQWPLITRLTVSVVLSVIAWWSYPWIIDQSREQLGRWMNDPVVMQNLATLMVVEALVFIIVDLSLLKAFFGFLIKKQWKYLGYFPGVLLPVVVLYFQMMVFYSVSTIEFEILGIYYALVVAVLAFIFPAGIKWLIPENYLRMEVRYILNFGVVLAGIVITVFCQGLTYPAQKETFLWSPLLLVGGLSSFMFLAGWAGSNFLKSKKIKWKY